MRLATTVPSDRARQCLTDDPKVPNRVASEKTIDPLSSACLALQHGPDTSIRISGIRASR